jgi:phosphomevalonate kinase
MSPPQRSTLRGSPVVCAPGKVFLIGEYAVLDGAPAVVAAVSRTAVGQFVPGIDHESPFVAEAVQATLAGIGDRAHALPPGSVLIDTAAFSLNGKKLGLGSSAAVAAASVAAVMELAGLPVADNRDLCFSLAEGAHRAAQGGVGSGADVAAAVHGGLVQYRRPAGGYPVVEKMRLPSDLRLVVFAEGKPAATPDLLRIVRGFAERDPDGYAKVMRPLREHAELFVEALNAGSVDDLLAAARGYGDGLMELGNQAETPIVTSRFEIAADLAANLGGVAKPSGAGGGDVGIALFGELTAARTFSSRLTQLGLHVIDVGLDSNGVHRRQPSLSTSTV